MATNVITSTDVSAAVAGTPGTLPFNWGSFGQGGLALNVVAFGTSAGGFPYCRLRLVGTTTTTAMGILTCAPGPHPASPITVAQYTYSQYVSINAGSTANITSIALGSDGYTGVNGTYVSGPIYNTFTVTGAETRYSATGTYAATTTVAATFLYLIFASGVAIDITLDIAAAQLELGATPTAFQRTPGVTLSEAASAVASPTATMAASVVSFSEFAMPADAPTATMAGSLTLAESGSAVDGISYTMPGTSVLAEVMTAIDTPTFVLLNAATRGEVAVAADTLGLLLNVPITVAEAAAAAERLTIIESPTPIADAIFALLPSVRTLEGGPTPDADAINALLPSVRILEAGSENIFVEFTNATATQTIVFTTNLTLAEHGNAADFATGSVAGTSPALISEAGIAADTATITAAASLALAETGALADAVSLSGGLGPNFTEAASAADTETVTMTATPTLAEFGNAADVYAIGIVGGSTGSLFPEAAFAVDAPTITLAVTLSLSETATLADVVSNSNLPSFFQIMSFS